MLTIIVPGDEFFDDSKQEFITINDSTLQLEHSLVSLSKWESVFEKPFLGKEEKTPEEALTYVKFMIIGGDFPPEVFSKLTEKNLDEVSEYINAKKTATWFNETPNRGRNTEVITSELIYYWLILYNIPFECQYWHLNRLFTLIRVCSIKNEKPKKMSRGEMLAQRRALNEQRRSQTGSRG